MNTKILTTLLLLGVSSLHAELFTDYFKDGTVKSKVEYAQGTRTDVTEGVKDGLEEIFYNSGELAYKVKNVEGKRHGPLDWYDREGNHLEVLHYKMGERHGENKIFYADGKLRSDVTYIDDKKEGYKKDYFSTGELAKEVNYVHDRKHGVEKEYYVSGKLSAEAHYKNNYKEGEKVWYDEKGTITKSETFKMGRPINVMKKVQAKKPDATIEALKGLDFNPNNRKVD